MARNRTRSYTVRRMPRIYGATQPRYSFSLSTVWLTIRRLFALILIGGCAYVVFFGPLFRIHTITVEGALFFDQTSLQKTLPYGENLWLLNREKTIQPIIADPIVDSVAILRGLPDELRIIIQEKKPVMIWQSGDTLCVLDSNGYCLRSYTQSTFPPSSTAIGARLASLPRVTDTLALPAKMETQLVSPLFIQFLNQATGFLSTLLPDQPLARWEVSGTTYDITAVFQNGMTVKMDTMADAGVQTRNLARLIQQKKAGPTSSVDLRINRWAFVK